MVRTRNRKIAHHKETIRVIDRNIEDLELEMKRIKEEIERLKDQGHIHSMILDELLGED